MKILSISETRMQCPQTFRNLDQKIIKIIIQLHNTQSQYKLITICKIQPWLLSVSIQLSNYSEYITLSFILIHRIKIMYTILQQELKNNYNVPFNSQCSHTSISTVTVLNKTKKRNSFFLLMSYVLHIQPSKIFKLVI